MRARQPDTGQSTVWYRCSGAAARARLGHACQLGAPAAHHAVKVGVRELRHELGAVGLRRGQLLLERGLKLRPERHTSPSRQPGSASMRWRPGHGGRRHRRLPARASVLCNLLLQLC